MTDEPMEHTETEILMTRLVDREASGAERDRFERLAESDRSLWRDLALRQLEMGLLAEGVQQRTADADAVDLPAPRRRWLALGVTVSGWAAVVVLGLLWTLSTPGDRGVPGDGVQPAARPQDTTRSDPMTPQEHLDAYLQADWVLGELDEILLETVPLPDGRVRLRYLRRIEEHVVIDEPVEHYVDEFGRIKVDPGATPGK